MKLEKPMGWKDWEEPEFRVDPVLKDLVILAPVKAKGRVSAYSKSRLAVLEDLTTMPVLHVLAREKYGEWDEHLFRPGWVDGNWKNEVLDNVALYAIAVREATDVPKKSKYGVPSGTKEYRAAWRKDHPDAVRGAQKRAYAKRRELLIEAKRLQGMASPSARATTPEPEVQAEEDLLLSRLEALLGPPAAKP